MSSEPLCRTETSAEGREAIKNRSGGEFCPDLVLVFGRPEDARPTCCGGAGNVLTLEQVNVVFDRVLQFRKSMPDNYKECLQLQDRMAKDGSSKVHLREVQNAFIVDVVNYMFKESCATLAFNSIDDDELFLCISLGNPKLTAQRDPVVMLHAEQAHLRAQTSFNSEIAEAKLHILQTIGPSEEMFVECHYSLLEAMVEVCQFPRLTDQDAEGPTLLKQYSAGIAGTDGSVIRSISRFRLLMSLLESQFDLDDAKAQGVVLDYFWPHQYVKLEEFRSGKKRVEGSPHYHIAHDAWSNFKLSTITKVAFASVEDAQPFQEIRDYYGERVAFFFLWQGYTAKMTIIAVPFFVCLAIAQIIFHSKSPRVEAYAYGVAAVCVSLGVELYRKGWNRLESYHAELWDAHRDSTLERNRPKYRGRVVPDPLNEHHNTTQYPAWKALAVYLLALAVTVFFMFIVICCVTLVYFMETLLPKELSSMVSLVFTLQIIVFQTLWDIIAPRLVELANPRTANQAKDFEVQFLFPFSFISTYANLIFHAFYTSWGMSCLAQNCMVRMRPALYQVVIPALFVQVTTMLVPYFKYRHKLNNELKEFRVQNGMDPDTPVYRSFLEAQAKRPTFDAKVLNTEMNTMVILLGYVILFGFAAPGVTGAVAIAFALKVRIDAFKLCSVYQRPIPATSATYGIGEWNDVIKMVCGVGRFFACAIPIFNLEYFNDGEEFLVEVINGWHVHKMGMGPKQKLLVVLGCKMILDWLVGMVDYAIADKRGSTDLMKAKRATTALRLTAQMASLRQGEARRLSKELGLSPRDNFLQADSTELIRGYVQGERSIPKLDNMHWEWTEHMGVDYAPAFAGKTYFGAEV